MMSDDRRYERAPLDQNEATESLVTTSEATEKPEYGPVRKFTYQKPKKAWRTVLIAFLAGAITLGGWGYALGGKVASWAQGPEVQFAGQTVETDSGLSDADPAVVRPNHIADIVKKAGPAVVKINTIGKAQGGQTNPLMSDPFFRQFFGDRNFGPSTPEGNSGIGTGFVISKDGYIITNQHVIQGAEKIEVEVEGYEKPLVAKAIGADFELDLAVIKVEAPKDLPTLPLGNSDNVMVGDWVVAIGNPYGYDHTVTVGVVSAKGRPVGVEDRNYKNLLQTDASINPGNSGGPLLNLKGEVIGINTAVSAQAQGIGFAIPTSTVQEVLKDLLEEGKVIRPWLGVSIQTVNQEIADYFKLEKAEGAIIAQVIPDSPAAKAGLQQGDVILEVNGEAVKTADDLIKQIRALKVDDQAMLLILREGEQQFVTMKIEAKPSAYSQ
jgi:serine protease Do